MNIKQLIEHLEMMPSDMKVYIAATKDDFATPLERQKIKVFHASICKATNQLDPATLVLTATTA